jgi:hypothetical protein
VDLEIAERQIVAKAECIPAEPCNWRPVAQARSARALSMLRPEISCFSTKLAWLLRVDLYAQIPADGGARFQGLIRRNDELAASMCEKDTEMRTSQKNEG